MMSRITIFYVKKKETKHPYNKYIIFLRSLIHINTDGVVPSGDKSDVPR
jgi:hypothetical protein